MGISDPTLKSLTPTDREGLISAYAIDVSTGVNIKQLAYIKPSTLKDYLKAAASFALEQKLPDPRYRYNKFGVRLQKCFFPQLQQWMSFITKWDGPTNKAWSLDMKIFLSLKDLYNKEPPLSQDACAIDAIILGSYTGSRCSEYCKGTTRKGESFAIVPRNDFTKEWGGLPIALISRDVAFMDMQLRLLTLAEATAKATYVSIRFRFDKGGGQNFSTRTFRRLDKKEHTLSFFCPVLTAIRLLKRWLALGGDINFPLCCFKPKTAPRPAVLADTHVTSLLRRAVESAYPDDNHLYRRNIKLFRTHSIRVFACCSLIAAGVSEAQIEYKLRWSSQAWKTYIRESLAEVDDTSLRLFHSARVS